MTIQEIVGLLDRSGSMHGKEADTVGGINAMFNEVKSAKKEEDTVRVSLKLFDDKEDLKWRSVDINEITDFSESEFIPRGTTALLDALGFTLSYFMEKKLLDPRAYDSCVIYVATDGLENASKEFTRNKIKKLIQTAQETYNITILYLGANQDAILEASNIGIGMDHAINYSENTQSTQAVYRSAARVASDARTQMSVGFSQVEREASQAL